MVSLSEVDEPVSLLALSHSGKRLLKQSAAGVPPLTSPQNWTPKATGILHLWLGALAMGYLSMEEEE